MEKLLRASYTPLRGGDQSRPRIDVREASFGRRDAMYQPSYWNYDRIQSLTIHSQDEKAIEKLKHDVVNLLNIKTEVFQKLELVDALEQLGVAYHFEKDIHSFLTYIQSKIYDLISKRPNDLYTVSQLFRILRSHGFEVSQDVFKNFRDDTGGFMTGPFHDHKGMLSLYQASFLGMIEEDTLDDAREITTKHLIELLNTSHLDSNFKLKLAYALELPLHWRNRKLHARWFIDDYEKCDDMNPTVLEFAKLDFNVVQNMNKKEVKELSRWWNNLDIVGEKTSHMRNRLMECYYLTVGGAPEPKLRRCRAALTKISCLLTVIDDCYDVYGTLDELELFTEAINRWDASKIKVLPNCLKLCFLATFNTINDVGSEVFRDTGVDVIPLLKKSVVDICTAFLLEGKWYYSSYMPSLEEYMNNAWISIGGPVLMTFAYCSSEDITSQAVEEYDIYSEMVRSSSSIFRLLNDLKTSSLELKRGDVPKSVQCYMFENRVSEIDARKCINQMIGEHWKILNCHRIPSSVHLDTYRSLIFDLPRPTHSIYQHDDGLGCPNGETKDRVSSLLVKPVPL